MATLLTALFVCLFAVPNFFPEETVKSWPKWAQRHVVLGLDLQGGSHILLEVESMTCASRKPRRCATTCATRCAARACGYTGLVIRDLTVEVRIREESDFQAALTKLRELSQPLGGILSATGQRSVDVVDAGNRVIRLTVTQPAITERMRQVVEQAIQIVERRINEIGTVEPLIQRQGVDRILVQVPGVDDPTRILETARPDREADLPHGRHDGQPRAGAAGPRAARIPNCSMGPQKEGKPALRDREARDGLRRGPDRRAAGLRPAHQRADRQLQVQHQRRAPLRPA